MSSISIQKRTRTHRDRAAQKAGRLLIYMSCRSSQLSTTSFSEEAGSIGMRRCAVAFLNTPKAVELSGSEAISRFQLDYDELARGVRAR